MSVLVLMQRAVASLERDPGSGQGSWLWPATARGSVGGRGASRGPDAERCRGRRRRGAEDGEGFGEGGERHTALKEDTEAVD